MTDRELLGLMAAIIYSQNVSFGYENCVKTAKRILRAIKSDPAAIPAGRP